MRLFLLLSEIVFLFGIMNEAKNPVKKINLNTQEINGDSIRCNKLNIDYLNRNSVGKEIRVWIEFSRYDSGEILIIKNIIDHQCQVNLHRYRFNVRDNGDLMLVSHNIQSYLELKSDAYIKKIKKLGIDRLNDRDRSKNYGLCFDGGAIKVEILNENGYRQYIYPCWEDIKDQAQINIIKDVLKESEKRFGFQIFPLDIKLK